MEEWPKISSDSQMLWASGTFLMNWKGMPFKRIWKAWGKGTVWYKSGKRHVLAKWLWEKLNFLSLFPFLNNGFWRIWKSSKRTQAIKFYMNYVVLCTWVVLFFFFLLLLHQEKLLHLHCFMISMGWKENFRTSSIREGTQLFFSIPVS